MKEHQLNVHYIQHFAALTEIHKENIHRWLKCVSVEEAYSLNGTKKKPIKKDSTNVSTLKQDW